MDAAGIAYQELLEPINFNPDTATRVPAEMWAREALEPLPDDADLVASMQDVSPVAVSFSRLPHVGRATGRRRRKVVASATSSASPDARTLAWHRRDVRDERLARDRTHPHRLSSERENAAWARRSLEEGRGNHDHRFQTHFCTVFFFHAAAWQRFAFFCFARLEKSQSRIRYRFWAFHAHRSAQIPALLLVLQTDERTRIKYSVRERSRETRAISDDFARSPMIQSVSAAARACMRIASLVARHISADGRGTTDGRMMRSESAQPRSEQDQPSMLHLVRDVPRTSREDGFPTRISRAEATCATFRQASRS